MLHKKANQIALTWKERMKLALQIAEGMEVLHAMKPPILHRDLKSLNVFITKKEGEWVGKVADFGLSRCPDAALMTSALGTLVREDIFSIGWLRSYWRTSSTLRK